MTKLIAITLFGLTAIAGLSTARAATTPLEQSMKRMATAYHALDKDLKTPDETKKASYVALASAMKDETVISRKLVPKKVAAMPQDQQAAQIADFQKSLDDLGTTIDTLTADLQASKWDAAKADIAKLKQQEDDGHKKFRVEKKEGAPASAAPATPATP